MAEDNLKAIVARMVEAGESEDNIAAVIKRYNETRGTTQEPRERPGWLKAIPAITGQAGGMLSGRSLPSAGFAAAGGAVGEGLRGLLEFLYDPSQDTGSALGKLPARMMVQGVKQGAAELAGDLVGQGGRLSARGMYRAAAGPVNQLAKYGDLVESGLRNRIPVSQAGLAKAGQLMATRKGAKDAAIAAADNRVTFRARGITDDARKNLDQYAANQIGAAQVDPTKRFTKQLSDFESANANGDLVPSVLEQRKRTIDDTLGGAYLKKRKREPLTPREAANMELSQAASRAQESAIPGYRDMNKGIMEAEGLRRMVERRVGPGSGGNQGLENALTMLGGASALPARIAMLPPVMSRMGIGLNEVAKVAPMGTGVGLRALLALLEQDPEQDHDK